MNVKNLRNNAILYEQKSYKIYWCFKKQYRVEKYNNCSFLEKKEDRTKT